MTRHNQGYAFRYSTSLRRLDRLLELLQVPMTRHELADAMGLSVRAVQAYLTMLLAEQDRRIHIGDWRRASPGSPAPIYVAGPGKDKRKPRAFTASERSRKRYKCPEYAMDQMAINRAKRMRLQRDPLTAALFGVA